MQKRTYKDYICQTCNDIFSSCKGYASRIPRFCSKDCYAKSLEIHIECGHCKTVFLKKWKTKFCSLECSSEFRKGKPSGTAKTPKEYICVNCTSVFTSKKGCKTRTPRFCSCKCSASFMTDEKSEKMSVAKRGKSAWNKGVAMWANKEHPRGALGRKYPERSGSNCHFWRGGVSSETEKARKSPEYKEWRTKVFKRDNYTCQICKQKGGKLHADHIKPFAYFKELRFEISNGRTLCVSCHYKTDTYGSKALKYSERLTTLGLEAKRIT